MRKNRYILMLAAACAVAACSQPELQGPDATDMIIPGNAFGAGVEGAVKVAIQSDYTLHWEENDGVAVWNGTAFTEYTASSAGSWTILTGEDVNTELAHCAFYPYSDDLEFAEDKVTATIPSVQTPVKGNFPYNPSVAYAAAGEKEFAFYNVCGLVGFEITKENISNVVIFGNNGENLTGKVTIPCTSTAPAATVVEGVKSVTLQAEDVFEKGVYYVAVLPQYFEKGITITMNGTDGTQDKKDSQPFTLHRSRRINADRIDAGEFGTDNEISNAAELQAFFNVVNADENKGAGMTARLVADIDMTGVKLVPAAEFAGTFDGSYLDGETTKNHVISNWNTTGALFGKIAATGVVKNVTVNGTLAINADDDAAFIALDNAGTISHCTTQGSATTLPELTFTKERAVGAIAARTSGTIEHCTNEAAINLNPLSTSKWETAELTAHQFIGGIAGKATGSEGSAKISNCTNAGTVTYKATNGYISSMACVGGILGGTPSVLYSAVADWAPVNNVEISNCVNAATATVTYGYNKNANGNAYNNLMLAGIAGYLEGTISGSSNAALIKIDGYRTTDDHSGDHYVKNTAVAGVVGIVTGDVTSCSNSGKIDFSATISSGDAKAPYIGSGTAATVAGVVAKSFKGTISACENTGEMLIDMHMRQKNGSVGAIGGVVAYSYNSALKNCTNRGECTLTTRPKHQYIGGVAGHAAINSVPSALNNYGAISCDGGVTTTDNVNQSQTIYLAGVIGYLTGSNQDIKDQIAFSNEGDIAFDGGSTTGTKYFGGICGYVNKVVMRGAAGKMFVNKGDISIGQTTVVPGAAYVGGIHAYIKRGTTTIGYGVITHNSRNEGDITVSTSAVNVVGGCLGHFDDYCAYSQENIGNITVTNTGTGTLTVGGSVGTCRSGLYSMLLVNQGDITVTKTGSGYARVAGVHAGESGMIANAVAQTHVNSGKVTLKSGVAENYVGGITAYDRAASIYAENSGNIEFEYLGGATSPVLYAGLGSAFRVAGDGNFWGTYGGNITLKNVEGVTCHCGALAGYLSSDAKLGTLTKNENKTKIKNSAVINGVAASLDLSFLVGTNDGTLTDGYLDNLELAD